MLSLSGLVCGLICRWNGPYKQTTLFEVSITISLLIEVFYLEWTFWVTVTLGLAILLGPLFNFILRLLQSLILEPESAKVIHQALEAIPMQLLHQLSSDANLEVSKALEDWFVAFYTFHWPHQRIFTNEMSLTCVRMLHTHTHIQKQTQAQIPTLNHINIHTHKLT